jgi:1-phosphofructokinase family hexose kinase
MQPGGVFRAERVLVATGGKGMNVARAAHTLGQPLRVCAPLAGLAGQMVVQLAEAEGFAGHWCWYSPGETRTCVLVVDPQGNDATALNEPGMPLSPSSWQAFVQTVQEAASDAMLVTISGSLPGGIAATELAALARVLTDAGKRVIIDSSGAPLAAILQTATPASAPYGVKVNQHELGATLGMPIGSIAEAGRALAALRERGIHLAAVSLGAQGALIASEQGVCLASPPAIQLVSSIGSGDSLLAGLATGLLRGDDPGEALRLGVACGTADALTIGGGLIYPADIEHLREATAIHWLDTSDNSTVADTL